MTGTPSFTVHCKVLPITSNAEHIEFFNLMADAIQKELIRLGENGVWFESAKVYVDEEKHEILFGYPKQLTMAILQRIFSVPFTLQDKINLEFHGQYYHDFSQGICHVYHASSAEELMHVNVASDKHRLYFIDNDVQAFREKNERAKIKSQYDTYSNPGNKHENLHRAFSLSRESLFQIPVEGEASYLKANFQSCDFLFYGESQQPQARTTQHSYGHDYILKYMDVLKESGVTKVYSEYFLKDQQPLIDFYFEDKDNPIPIELEQYALATGGNTVQFLRALKENGIRLIGLENTASTNGSAYDASFRTGSFNHHAAKTIRKHHQPGEKSIIEVAGAHLLASTSIHNLLQVEGFYPRFGK